MSLLSSVWLSPASQGIEPPPVPVIEKVTVPVGMPVEGLLGATTAVNITGWPVTVGFDADVSVVVVRPLLMTAPPAIVPVLVTKLESPE